jgi:hypothetical protein
MSVIKSLVVVACYVLSGFGIFLAWIGSIFLLSGGGWYQLMLLLWLGAAIAHLRLSIAWIENRRLGKKVSLLASVVSLLGLFSCPAALQLSDRESLDLHSAAQFAAMQLLTVSPAFLLACNLAWYHSSKPGRSVAQP